MVLSWKQADWNRLAYFIYTIDWITVFSNCATVDDRWSNFSDILDLGTEYFEPKCKYVSNGAVVRHTKRVKKIMSKRKHQWRLNRLSPCATNDTDYKIITA